MIMPVPPVRVEPAPQSREQTLHSAGSPGGNVPARPVNTGPSPSLSSVRAVGSPPPRPESSGLPARRAELPGSSLVRSVCPSSAAGGGGIPPPRPAAA
jgi:hypothetical protein